MNAVDEVYKYVEYIMGYKNFECDRNKKIGYRFYHSRLVANLCIYILENSLDEDIPKDKKKEMSFRKESICIAALLHDLKKNEKHHAEKAAASLKYIFRDISEYTKSSEILSISDEDITIIEDMIRKHGSHGSDNEKHKYYIRLIQDADNISRYVNYLPEDVFNYVFDIRKDKKIFFNPKEKIKEKHKKLNYILSRRILKIV